MRQPSPTVMIAASWAASTASIGVVGAFVVPSAPSSTATRTATRTATATATARATSTTRLYAAPQQRRLTERQLQFWEDVDDGLGDVEKAYPNQSIERIRTFAASARGDIDPPIPGAVEGHLPSEEHVEGLTALPFWESDAALKGGGEGAGEGAQELLCFPWAAELEEKSGIIREEFEGVLREAADTNDEGGMFAGDSAWQNKVMGEGWSAFRLQRLGEWNAENCAKFPETYSILRSLRIPLAVRGVCFARQLPGSGVAPHTDGRNFILTSHLGLNVPESEGAGGGKDDDTKNDGGPRKGPWIKVGTETRKWTEGKLVTLDTSFEHSTGNPTRGVRDVLIVDFWHPELTEAERASLEFVYDLRNKFERGEIPVRKPRSVILAAERKEQEDKDGGGLGGLWKSLTGGGGGESGESGD